MRIKNSLLFEKKTFELRKENTEISSNDWRCWSSHGGTLSCVEILTYLYLVYKINLNKKNWNSRDRVLVKGHAHLALYQLWAELGLIKKRN